MRRPAGCSAHKESGRHYLRQNIAVFAQSEPHTRLHKNRRMITHPGLVPDFERREDMTNGFGYLWLKDMLSHAAVSCGAIIHASAGLPTIPLLLVGIAQPSD